MFGREYEVDRQQVYCPACHRYGAEIRSASEWSDRRVVCITCHGYDESIQLWLENEEAREMSEKKARWESKRVADKQAVKRQNFWDEYRRK